MISTDYLVIGGGAMGMAFTDTILTETDATVTIVDRRARPGGHWNDAYPFVRLHQPSAFYGVNSLALGEDRIDQVGWNEGLYELASGTEVVTYFDQVMRQQFLPSGRVQYFPMSDYQGDNRFASMVSGEQFEVEVARRTVDASYMNVSVPSTHPPAYTVAAEAQCVPLNDLVRTAAPPDGYVIIGAGKTGADACLWLLANGVDPDAISWVMPRDSWYLDRAQIQPGVFAEDTVQRSIAQTVQLSQATSIEDLFARLESEGLLLRLDQNVQPRMYRCSTVTTTELEQLRRIERIVRLGRVQAVEADRIVLDEGTIPTTTGTVHVDCSADGLARRTPAPIFDGDNMTLQTVRHCQQVFSAALIGHVEASYEDDETKNELCAVVPHPDTDVDWIRSWLGTTLNTARWRSDPELGPWLQRARLDGFSSAEPPSESQQQLMAHAKELTIQAIDNANRFLTEAPDGRI